MTGRSLDASELLRIDYAAERRKLAEAAFDAPWCGIAELARRAVRKGATRIAIRCAPEALVVTDDGEPPGAALLAAFATCRDAHEADSARHAALVRLEAEPGLVAASLRARASIARERGETRVRLEGYRLEVAGRAALGEALCFCGAAVTLDGSPVPRGFAGAFAEAEAPRPLRGTLALGPARLAEVALLLDGVAVARVSLPDAPPFAAWIDGASILEPKGASPARLREAFAEHAPRLVAAAADLALSSVPRSSSFAEPARAALLETLLACARLGLRRADVLRASVLPAFVGGRRELRSLLALGEDAEASGGRTVTALDPSRDPREALLPPEPVYVLDAETRARIAALLDVRFRPVPSRSTEAPFGARWRRMLLGARAGLRQAALRLRGLGAGRRLEERELEPAERALLTALGAGVAFSAGKGPVRRTSAEWRLARGAELVRRAARAVAADPRWRYAASLALFRGRRETPPAWAGEWRGP